MADDFTAVVAVQTSFPDAAGMGRDLPMTAYPRSLPERAEGAVQWISRWAGIFALCAAVAGIAYLIF